MTYTEGMRVRHEPTGKTGTIQAVNQTYFPTIKKTHYQLLVKGDNGHEFILPARQFEIIK